MATLLPESSKVRFWQSVNFDPMSGCWLWGGHADRDGYGFVFVSNAAAPRCERAHRFSWRLHKGAVPPGAFVCHHCDTPACVNPDHLYVGDALTNQRDAIARDRNACGERHGARQNPDTFPRKGEKNGRAKITAEDVRAIRACAEDGVTLGKWYGLKKAQISSIRLRKAWRHV